MGTIGGKLATWAFIVGRRGEREHDRLVRHLARSSARRAPAAGLLVGAAHRLCRRSITGRLSEHRRRPPASGL